MDENALPRATAFKRAGEWPAVEARDTLTLDYDDRHRRRRRYTGEGGLAVLLDLPEAAVAIQVSGTFGSRQEEAQRLGRVLRPKADGRQAHFYTVVSRDTLDAEYAAHRQRFLAEQGYAYTIVDAADLAGPGEVNGPDWVDEPAD